VVVRGFQFGVRMIVARLVMGMRVRCLFLPRIQAMPMVVRVRVPVAMSMAVLMTVRVGVDQVPVPVLVLVDVLVLVGVLMFVLMDMLIPMNRLVIMGMLVRQTLSVVHASPPLKSSWNKKSTGQIPVRSAPAGAPPDGSGRRPPR
jgi:hypothetical protein